MIIAKVRQVTATAAIVISLTAGAAVANSDLKDHLLIDSAPLKTTETEQNIVCPVIGETNAPTISFASPKEMLWFDMDTPVPEIEDHTLLAPRQVAQGYIPESRDRLELSLICAEHNLDLVASGTDLGRIILDHLDNRLLYGETRGLDIGDVLGRDKSRDVTFINRIGTWRMGPYEVILRARYEAEAYAQIEPMLERIFGTFEVQWNGSDPVASQLARFPVAKDQNDLQIALPGNWQLLRTEVNDRPSAVHMFNDRNDTYGNAAITVIWRTLKPESSEKLLKHIQTLDSPKIREIVKEMIDLEISNLLSPEVGYSADDGIAAIYDKDHRVGYGSQTIDARVLINGADIPARSQVEVMLGEGQVLVLGALYAYPEDAANRARYLHTLYAIDIIRNSLRAQTAFAPR